MGVQWCPIDYPTYRSPLGTCWKIESEQGRSFVKTHVFASSRPSDAPAESNQCVTKHGLGTVILNQIHQP